VHLDDASLAAQVTEGNAEALEAIWDRYAPLVRSILARGIGTRDDVEDFVQEVFLRFYANRSKMREPSSLRSFLFGIAIRVAATERRTRRVRSWLELHSHEMLEDVEPPRADHDARRAIVRLYAILDKLDANSRLGFVLHFIEGRELADVAAAFDVSLATIKRRLSRAYGRVFARAQVDDVLAGYLVQPAESKDP